jgi:hypothetical protein
MSKNIIYNLENSLYSFEFYRSADDTINVKLYEDHGSHKNVWYFWETLTPEILRDLADKLEEFKNKNI